MIHGPRIVPTSGAREPLALWSVRLPRVSEWQDAPKWLLDLVVSVWQRDDWRALEVWRERLAKRDVTPDMLEPVGDPTRPIAISATPPGMGWLSGTIDWHGDSERTAVLNGLRRLVEELDHHDEQTR